MAQYRLKTPLSEEDVLKLRIGDEVLLSGVVYTARDLAHKRLVELIERDEPLPFDIKGAVIFYVGPAPAPPGRPIGSAGPTTAYRMDPFTPKLLELGLKATIGKGGRGPEVKEALKRYKAVYFAAIGGVAALLADRIKEAEVIAFEDLGPEAVRRLVVEDFPVIVACDAHGGDLFEEGKKKYRALD